MPLANDSRAYLKHGRLSLAVISLALLAGCAVAPKPLDMQATQQQAEQDMRTMFQAQEPLTESLGLQDAMARALKYNLDSRLQLMEQAMALGQLEVSRFEMLPRVAASAGYVGRSNTSASSSESILTNQQSLEPSQSQDTDRRVADLTMVWNVLDFGVGYYSAKQTADKTLITEERRRKVVQNTLQAVSAAYWRAVAAERLIARIDPLMMRVSAAQKNSAALESLRLRSPLDALNYQRTLLETLSELESQRQELALAKTTLAALIGLSPNQDFELRMPEDRYPVPELKVDMDRLEEMALVQHPELREERYQARISALETRKALLRMLPGIEFNVGGHYDSNSFLVNNRWADYGAKVTWNLMNLLSGPSNIRYAEAGEELAAARRQALSMAVLTQLYVARANFEESVRRFRTVEELYAIDQRILEQYRAGASTNRVGELALIQSELSTIQSALARDLLYADVRNSFAKIFTSAGADPLPSTLGASDLEALGAGIEAVQMAWQRGEVGAE